jgi:hypothetical protein
MVDSTLAFNILARDRGASAVFDKVARSADKTSASLKKTGQISDDVAKASDRLTKARDSETNALDRVQVAEAKLSELRNNSKAKASQILAAEKNLAKARREAAAAGNVAQKAAKDLGDALDHEGKKAGKSLGGSLRRWFTGDGKNVFKQVGEDGGTVFGSGLLGALKTPVLGPAIIAVVGATVATVMPAVGAIAAGGLAAGFGAGLSALGIVFAAKSVAVKNAWNRALASMGADMRVLSAPFEKTLIAMAGFAKRTFNTFKPALSSAFKEIAPELTAFGDQLGRAFEKLVPAIKPMADAFSNVLRTLGPAMQSAVGKVSQGLQDLARSVSANPGALADLVKGMGDVIKTLLDGITTLNNINGAFERFTGGVSGVDVVMGGLRIATGALFSGFVLLEKALNALGIKTDDVNSKVEISADTAKLWTQGLNSAQVATVNAGGAVAGMAPKVESLAAKFDRQKAATDKLIESLFRLQNGYITLAGAQIAYQAAVDAGTKSVKDNGKTLDVNTEKGRNNKQALIDLARAANDQTESMLRNNKGQAAAYTASAKSREAFVRLAMQMGATRPQAIAMAKSMIAIPNVTREARLTANKKDLEGKLASAKAALNDKNLTKERRAELNANIKRLVAQINAAQAKINSLQGKTVNIVTKYTTVGSRSSGSGSGGGRVNEDPHRASGGPVMKGVPYVVGEHRPELFVPNENGTILPKVPRSARGAAFTAGGTTININVNGARDPRAVTDEIVRELRKFVRVTGGGDVQQALGVNR